MQYKKRTLKQFEHVFVDIKLDNEGVKLSCPAPTNTSVYYQIYNEENRLICGEVYREQFLRTFTSWDELLKYNIKLKGKGNTIKLLFLFEPLWSKRIILTNRTYEHCFQF